ncbi:fimbrillin family protein [Bacteroides pyogenes]|uniref:fimbrillin family protein n=1 Tax=Bacteroides pyogenes TaxID=310300 RepID=UPI001F1D6B93|nr:fimbrillin family protein [Bacteroides pyogenes]MCE9107129.1 fimbrillin family protein [Bacteroides pyogenes]
MKKTYCFAAAALLLMASCSNDEIVEQSKGEKIAFNVLSDNAKTRATPITSANLTSADFKVWGFITSGGTKYIKGVRIHYSGGKWDYANPSDVSYWPSSNLDIYAVSPATHDNLAPGFLTSSALNFTYQAPEDNAEQADVMYASNKGVSKSDGSMVSLVFKHALSQIVFKGKAGTTMAVRIKSIKVHNLKKSGTFTFPVGTTETGSSSGAWALSGNADADYVVGTVKTLGQDHVLINGVSLTDLTAPDGALLILPQTATKWTTTEDSPIPIATADTQNQCYLEIEMKLTQSGVFLIGNESTYGKVYVPFGGTAWEPGKKYIYTLNFGGGYDADGKVILSPMKFTPTVEDWTDSPSDITLPPAP